MSLGYSAQKHFYGAILEYSPIKLINCSMEKSESDEKLEKNRLFKEDVLDVLSKYLMELENNEKYVVESGPVEEEKYSKTFIPETLNSKILTSINGDQITAEIVVLLGINPLRYSSVFVETTSDAKIQLGTASKYFEGLREISKELAEGVCKEYLDVFCGKERKQVTFEVNSLGLEIPEDGPLRLLLKSKKRLNAQEKGEQASLMKNEKEAKLISKDFNDIHGTVEDTKYNSDMVGTNDHIDFQKRHHVSRTTIGKMVRTTMLYDVPSSKEMSEYIIDPMENLVGFNKIPLFIDDKPVEFEINFAETR